MGPSRFSKIEEILNAFQKRWDFVIDKSFEIPIDNVYQKESPEKREVRILKKTIQTIDEANTKCKEYGED